MCNIAGYVGNRPAAPILLEMIRRQEGFAGGYYTGLATIHEGKLSYRKLTGDVRRLETLTDVAHLPGTIGIVHSRSKSGGGDSWAHPFIGRKDGEDVLAYVANGSLGAFAPRSEEYAREAERLLSLGYAMDSQEINDNPRYQKLSDGSTVHMSDLMCQLIQSYIDGGKTVDAAMADAFCNLPAQIVGLCISLADPTGIFWSRIDMPMTLGFASHGAYLSSTALAMPDDAKNILALPVCSSGKVTAHGFESVPYPNPPAEVYPLTAELRAAAFQRLETELRKEPIPFAHLQRYTKELFPRGALTQTAMLAYDTLFALSKREEFVLESRRVPGAFEELDAPKFFMHLS